jgi:hypothetical protein
VYPRSSPYEKVLASGLLLGFVGVGGLVFLGLHGISRLILVLSMMIGFVMSQYAFFALARNRSRALHRIQQSSDAKLWMGIATIFLWLLVLPLVVLWVYHKIHFH